MEIKAGQAFITQGSPKSIASLLVRLFSGSWWTHGFIAISETEAIEAAFPRVKRLNIQHRLDQLRKSGRDVVIMDLPNITDEQRLLVAEAALKFEGRLYDIWNAAFYAIFGWWVEGGKRLVCSRLQAASFYDGINVKIFPKYKLRQFPHIRDNWHNLEDGYCTPDEIFRYSILKEIHRIRA